jgi:hypothetical protein
VRHLRHFRRMAILLFRMHALPQRKLDLPVEDRLAALNQSGVEANPLPWLSAVDGEQRAKSKKPGKPKRKEAREERISMSWMGYEF